MASIAGIVGEPEIPADCASKAGVCLFTRAAAIHCARMGYGIRINCVCPGWSETHMVSGALSKLEPADAQAMVERITQHIPQGLFGKPDEIAHSLLFLASEESSYMTGADFVVDGGYTAS